MKKQNQNDTQSVLLWQELTPKKWWLYLVPLFLVVAVFAWWFSYNYWAAHGRLALFYFGGGDKPGISTGTAAATVYVEEDESDTVGRRLDGVLVDREQAHHWPYAVMMENLLSVRPQSGMSQAAIVYEALVEGGATRFMAVYDPSENIPEIMPVRSARPYYLEWVSEFGALYAHAGGSPKALTVIWENPDINNLEALSRDGVYFWRDQTKSAPHNLVTSSEKMNFALRDKELRDKEADFKSWIFKDEAELDERGENGKVLSFNFSYGTTYKVDFAYHQEENEYARSNANLPHLDKNTGEQITVKNVVVQLVEEPVLNGGKGRLEMYVGGEGKAWIFRDGQVIEGTWKKSSRTDRTLFYDSDGQEVQFNRGNTWIHILTKTQEVSYQ